MSENEINNKQKLSKALLLSGGVTLGLVIAGLGFYDQIHPHVDKNIIDLILAVLTTMGIGEVVAGIYLSRSNKRL